MQEWAARILGGQVKFIPSELMNLLPVPPMYTAFSYDGLSAQMYCEHKTVEHRREGGFVRLLTVREAAEQNGPAPIPNPIPIPIPGPP